MPVNDAPTADVISAHEPASQPLSAGLIVVFAVACGLAVASLYYAQPLLETIGADFHVDESIAGLIVTITQLGYAAGLLLVAPLGDLLENRRLIAIVMGAAVLALVAAAFAGSFGAFIAASLAIGVTSVVAQILVPLAAHLAPPETRGRVVGQVMSGLLAGILLARAASGVLSGALGWRAVYGIAALLSVATVGVLWRVLPDRRPSFALGYRALLGSLAGIYRGEPILRRRAAYQSAMFGTFSLFWTGSTFLLSNAPFHYSQTAIGIFALAGAMGAFFAPIAGRLGDSGHDRMATGAAFLVAAAGFGLTFLHTQIVALVAGAICLDCAVQATLVLGQRAVYALNPAERSRINTLYIATFFVGGAAGSALAGLLYGRAGWAGIAALGVALPLAAFVYWLTEPASARAIER